MTHPVQAMDGRSLTVSIGPEGPHFVTAAGPGKNAVVVPTRSPFSRYLHSSHHAPLVTWRGPFRANLAELEKSRTSRLSSSVFQAVPPRSFPGRSDTALRTPFPDLGAANSGPRCTLQGRQPATCLRSSICHWSATRSSSVSPSCPWSGKLHRFSTRRDDEPLPGEATQVKEHSTAGHPSDQPRSAAYRPAATDPQTQQMNRWNRRQFTGNPPPGLRRQRDRTSPTPDGE